jgi:ATP-binding cassette subfamily F protein 3
VLKLHQLSKSYGNQVLFEDITLQMTSGERLGLVGRNGHGKSTLFRMILGEEAPDEGTISIPKGYRIGHLAQHLNFTQATVLEEGCLGLPPGEEDDHYKVERILFGLGFTEIDMGRPPSEFSGGFQIRLNLAKVLVSHPNLLLLDEPTNYLDIVSIRWITRFLRSWRNELILISHDRDFMDDVTTHTAAIHRCKLRKLKGGTEKLYAQILEEEEIHERTRLNEDKKRKQEEAFINRFRAQATKASAVQSRIKRLAKMPSLEKLAHIDHLDFDFHYSPFQADNMMHVNGLGFYFDPATPLIENLSFSVKANDRIAVVGKNGKGKSTLLNLLAGELQPLRGEIRRHREVRLGYFGQTNINRLQNNLTVEEEILSVNPSLGRTVVRGICGTMMFSGDKAEKKISVLSGGEKSRVLLGKILAEPANLVFLDEPTNHLDMESIEALVESIGEFQGAVIMVTHSEMILKALANRLVVFQHGNAELFEGSYQEFLDRRGWEEEEQNKSTKTSGLEATSMPAVTPSKADKLEVRKKRADLIARRSKTLGPLKKEIEGLEQEITHLEARLAGVNQQLVDASQKSQVDQFVRLSREVKELQKEIDAAYVRLDRLTTKHEQKTTEYESQLQQIGEG